MLGEGQRRARRGTDVVVGFVETHGRPHTAEMLDGLEVVPRQIIDYRGASFTEMDLDAVLARRPEVALVDELAHTNVPGQPEREALAGHRGAARRRDRRHLHGQHPAPGVAQRRRREDHRRSAARDRARTRWSGPPTRSSWSTWPPRRCAAGWRTATSTPPEKVDAALGNYFRVGNLTALRELALLWLADRVDEALQRLPRRSTASTAPGRPGSGSWSRSPAAPRARR